MSAERDEIQRALKRLAMGEEDVSGRTLASRISALRRLELMTRPARERGPERSQEDADYPCDDQGDFCPNWHDARWWALWRSIPRRPGFEVAAIARWDGRQEWEAAGRPFARSRWVEDQTEWRDALADLDR